MRPCQRDTSKMVLSAIFLRLLVQLGLYAGPPAGRHVVNGKGAVKLVELDLGYIKIDHLLALLCGICGQQIAHSGFQRGKPLFGGGKLCFLFRLFAGGGLFGQLLRRVQNVPLHFYLFVIGFLCGHTGHVHHLADVLAAVGILGDGLVVADLFHRFHGVVMDGLGLLLEVAFRQVGGFDGVAVTVNDFHKVSFQATRRQMYMQYAGGWTVLDAP
nr:MAG TPA: hypothetical protein [Caudoviricetes sp.]